MSDRTNIEIVREWFRRAWGERDEKAIDDLMAEDLRMHGLAPNELGREDLRAFHTHLLRLLPDMSVEVTHAMEDGEWVAVSAVVSGTHAESGKPVRFTGGGFARVDGGKLVETRECWDFLGLGLQTGAVAPAVATELLGAPPEL